MILWEILILKIPYFGIDPWKLINIVAEEKNWSIPMNGNEHIRKLTKDCLNYDALLRPPLQKIVDSHEKLLQTRLSGIYIIIFLN